MNPLFQNPWSTLPLLILLCWYAGTAANERDAAKPRSLAGQLQLMSLEQGFEISGLEQIDLAAPPAEMEEGTVTQQIRSLLRGYDHVIVHRSKKHIDRLMILGVKRAAPPPMAPDPTTAANENVIPTRRQGEHHLVTATLRGAEKGALQLELMVDTGASLVVLPNSAATQLGLDPTQLDTREMQTVKGTLEARIGRIGAIELGNTHLKQIDAAFVEDESLEGIGLLGMNVLGRYLFILDDENNRLTLIPEGK